MTLTVSKSLVVKTLALVALIVATVIVTLAVTSNSYRVSTVKQSSNGINHSAGCNYANYFCHSVKKASK